MTHETTIPRETVIDLVGRYRELAELQRQQQATQAEMIRQCVIALRADPTTHRLRGHEPYLERAEIVKTNHENKARALLYLEWLATQLENQAGIDLGEPTVTITKA